MKIDKTRFFLFPYIAIKHNKYVYGRQLYTVMGDLSIREVEHYIEITKEYSDVVITGIFEMSEDDYLESNLIEWNHERFDNNDCSLCNCCCICWTHGNKFISI